MSGARVFRPVAGAARVATRGFRTSARNLAVHDVKTKAEFDEAIKKPVVVLDAFATWCAPCKAISPILEKLSNEEANQGLHFIKIDVDELPEVSQQLGIRAMPTFMFFKDGEMKQQLVGADPNTLGLLIKKFRPQAE